MGAKLPHVRGEHEIAPRREARQREARLGGAADDAKLALQALDGMIGHGRVGSSSFGAGG